MRPLILVTGGAGFIGSNIVKALSNDGRYRLAVCDWLGMDNKWRNLANAVFDDFVYPDALPEFLEDHRSGLVAVVHMGAISSTTESDADLIMRNNFQLSRFLWDWCTAHGSRFVYASSAATYGDGTAGFDDDQDAEALAKLAPLNAYGWSKHAFDRFVAASLIAGEPTPAQWVGLKFFNVYGPNEYHKGGMRSVVSQLFDQLSAGERVRLFKSHNPKYEDGGQLRDFVYVKDCVRVILWLLDQPDVSGLFNLGTGQARSFLDLAHGVFAALDKTPDVEFVDTPERIRDKYQYFTQANMDKLFKAGFAQQFTPLESGVADYIQSYLMSENPYL